MTMIPTVDERVQLLAPLANVKPVGADPNFEIFPRSLLAAAVPVPEVVPPALSTVSEIELSRVPVTVIVPLDVAAKALVESSAAAITIVKSDLWYVNEFLLEMLLITVLVSVPYSHMQASAKNLV